MTTEIKTILTVTKSDIDTAALTDRSVFEFADSPHTPDTLGVPDRVGDWILRVVGAESPRVICIPTNKRTGALMRAGKIRALLKQYPEVEEDVIKAYVKHARGVPYVWEPEVQAFTLRHFTTFKMSDFYDILQTKAKRRRALELGYRVELTHPRFLSALTMLKRMWKLGEEPIAA